MCSPVYTNSDTPMVRFIPKDFILLYYNKLKEWLNFPEGTIDYIYNMSDEIMEKDAILSAREKLTALTDEKPQTVAAAILVFFMKIHGYSVDKENYKSIFRMSDMTINKIKKRVIKAYNEE